MLGLFLFFFNGNMKKIALIVLLPIGLLCAKVGTSPVLSRYQKKELPFKIALKELVYGDYEFTSEVDEDDVPTKKITPYSYPSATNAAKNVPIQTQIQRIPLENYAPFTIPFSTDTRGNESPNWGVWWQVSGNEFRKTIKPWDVGLTGVADYMDAFAFGAGQRGKDFIYYYNPDMGKPWANDIDPKVGKRWQDFVSDVPERHRLGTSQHGEDWSNKPLYELYDMGKNDDSSPHLGQGDNLNGKVRRGLCTSDVENGNELGSERHRAFLIGMAENTTGYVAEMYGAIFNTIGYKLATCYPDSKGNYSAQTPLSSDWAGNGYVTIPEKKVINKRLTDYPNIMPSTEVSFYARTFAPHGSSFPLGNGQNLLIDKFGKNANCDHPLSVAGTLLETQSWYCINKLGGRRTICLTKCVADKGPNIGQIDGDVNPEHRNSHCDRRTAFLLAMLNYFSKVDLYMWDRAFLDKKGIDCYNGTFAFMRMIATTPQKIVNGASLYPSMQPELWDTEQSYDGKTWVKEKAIGWSDSEQKLPCRSKKNANYWEVGCMRSEGVEPTEAWLRTTIDGTIHEIHITPDQWETTNPMYKGISLDKIPTKDKEYYYQLIKLK